jgi:exonuclease SbcC
MLLKKITLKNIRSYENQAIEFPKGSTLLSGDIGSGKTSILLGIEFALFGLQPGQRGISLLRSGESEGGIVIELEVDGREIIIERTLKKGKTISQDYCAITIDNEKKEISVSELKSRILGLLKYPNEFAKKQNILYKFTVYTPQEEMKQIILQDAETRMNTLRHVFGIDKYKKILENVSIIASKLREEKRLKEGLTANLENEKLELISKEENLEEKNSNLVSMEKELFLKTENRKKIKEEQKEIYEKIQEKNKFEQEIEKTKIMVANKEQSILDNRKTMETLNFQIQELSSLEFDDSKIKELELEAGKLRNEKEKINHSLLLLSSGISSLNLKIGDNLKLEKKISNLDICPTCLQDIEAVYRANVLNKTHNNISKLKKKASDLEEERMTLNKSLNGLNSRISSDEKEINDLRILKIELQGIQEKRVRLDEFKKLNQNLEKDASLLEEHTKFLMNSVENLKKFDLVFEITQKKFEESLRQERLAEIKVAELKKEIEVFSRQIDELRDRIKKTEEIKGKLNYIFSLEDWLSRKFVPAVSYVEKNVMARLKSEFSNLFEKWFCMLVSDSFDVSLREDFTPVIEHQDYEIDYAYLSGGERTAVALAYRLALNQVINSLLSKIKTRSLVILDEPTDGFSEQQLDKMRDVLQELEIQQLIIVSHEQKIESFVENVIRSKKENNVSIIEK